MVQEEHRMAERISKVISNIFNPIVSLLVFYIYHSFHRHTATVAFKSMIPLLVMVIFPVVYWIASNVRKGRYTNMDVSNRMQRRSLYYFIIAALMVYEIFIYLRWGAADRNVLFLILLLILLHFSNYFIKSSMHTALNLFVAALFYPENHIVSFVWLLLTVLIGITRLILKRHSVAEVFSGAAIGFVVSILYLYTYNQT